MVETGYYAQTQLSVDDFLMCLKNPSWNFDLDENDGNYDDGNVFLQGSCQLFAYALNEIFEYEVIEIRQGVSPHYFCKSVMNGLPIYIDIRGATSNLIDFVYGLKFITDIDCTEIKHCNEELIDELREPGATFGYDFAKYIIQTYPQYYDLRNTKGD